MLLCFERYSYECLQDMKLAKKFVHPIKIKNANVYTVKFSNFCKFETCSYKITNLHE